MCLYSHPPRALFSPIEFGILRRQTNVVYTVIIFLGKSHPILSVGDVRFSVSGQPPYFDCRIPGSMINIIDPLQACQPVYSCLCCSPSIVMCVCVASISMCLCIYILVLYAPVNIIKTTSTSMTLHSHLYFHIVRFLSCYLFPTPQSHPSLRQSSSFIYFKESPSLLFAESFLKGRFILESGGC